MGGNAPMFRIVDNRLLDLTVSVPSSRLADVKVGQLLEFSTDALPGRTFTGKVMFINPSIDEASRSAKVVAEVVNRDGALKGGSFVKGRILVATRTGVLQVPREALLNWNVEQQTAEVFVVKGDQAEKRAVKTGLGQRHASRWSRACSPATRSSARRVPGARRRQHRGREGRGSVAMFLSNLSIKRPVVATVMMLTLVTLGALLVRAACRST